MRIKENVSVAIVYKNIIKEMCIMNICGFYSKFQKINIWRILLFSLIPMVLVFVNPSCTYTNSVQKAEVVSLDIEIRQIQSLEAITSLSFWLIPRDNSGLLVKVDGTINAKLSRMLYQGQPDEEIRLIQEWDGIKITSEDFTLFGVEILLEHSERYSDSGILEVTLILPDGTSLISEVRNIDLENNYLC